MHWLCLDAFSDRSRNPQAGLILQLSDKSGFFSESAIRFSDLQISKKNIPKNYPELEI